MQVTVSDAKAQLTDLVRRAERGEEVVLTRHGQPIVTLKPVGVALKQNTSATMEWLLKNRITPKAGHETPMESLQALRDESER